LERGYIKIRATGYGSELMSEYKIGPIQIDGKLMGQIILCWVAAGILAYVAAVEVNLHSNFLTTIATVQASVLGIVIAFYILTTQLAADRFSVRIIEEVTDGSMYALILSIFGVSILSDLVVLLYIEVISKSAYFIFVSVFCTVTFSAVSFLSLFYAKDWLLERPHPDTIANSIRERLSSESIVQELKEGNRPFSEIFESIKITIRSDDKQAAGDLVAAICNPVEDNLPEVLEELSETESDSLISIINQVSSISAISFNEEVYAISRYCLNWLLSITEICYEYGFRDAGAYALQSAYPSLRDLMTNASNPDKTLSAINWGLFSEIYEEIGHSGHRDGISQSTNLVSSFSMDVEEAYEPVTSGPTIHTLSTLIDAFIEGWQSHLETSDELPTLDQVYWGDPKVMDIDRYKYSYNHYFDNFDTIFRSLSRLESKSIAEPGIFQIVRGLPRDFCTLSKAAYDNGSTGLAIQLSQIAVICGARFPQINNGPEAVAGILEETFADKSELEDIKQGIEEMKADQEVELFNTASSYKHFLTALAVADEEDWFDDLQSYISQLLSEIES
jgi:hypothetical protein